MGNVMELVEPYAVIDVYASGLAEVEDVGGGNYCLVFYRRHRDERQVAARIILAADEIPPAVRLMARKTNSCACAAMEAMARH